MFSCNRLISICLVALVILSGSLSAQGKNSTRKKRIKPTVQAALCGSAVNWRASVAEAVKESDESGKPVFWYVPTIAGTFMDRKPEIDRYMMAGPFSWPAIIGTLNEHYIPVRAVATKAQQKNYGVGAYKFVEPGFVILRDGKNDRQVDQLTTLNPEWLNKLLADIAGFKAISLYGGKYAEGWNALKAGNYEFDFATRYGQEVAPTAEGLGLEGMLLFRSGQHADAEKIWTEISLIDADHPLAWKFKAEAENWGPFVRGFEFHRELPDSAYAAGTKSRGSAAPSGAYSETELWQRSTEFLLAMQSDNGGWFDSDYDFGGADSLPNVYVAVSALCGSALLDARQRLPKLQSKIDVAIEKAAKYCSDTTSMNLVDRDEILWAHAYRVRFFSKLVQSSGEAKAKYTAALTVAVADLESIQTKRGGWYHEYSNPFVTATALSALKRASSAGAKLDESKIKAGVKSLSADRYENGAYPYSSSRSDNAGKQGKIPASAGRMPLCELALLQWNASDDEKLQSALTAAFRHHEYLQVSYKYDDHTSTLAYGGFFFWYDMRGRAEALTFLSNENAQKQFAIKHRALVMELPELDGCFVDSHELGRCYGTAMALLTLSLLDECDK
jgi:hypothetical protein